jgi:hypothetical protein
MQALKLSHALELKKKLKPLRTVDFAFCEKTNVSAMLVSFLTMPSFLNFVFYGMVGDGLVCKCVLVYASMLKLKPKAKERMSKEALNVMKAKIVALIPLVR